MGNRADRRRLGVNFFAVLRAMRKVTAREDFEPSSPRRLAEAVLVEIMGKDLATARRDEIGIDWDDILAFVEKLIAILLKLLTIF